MPIDRRYTLRALTESPGVLTTPRRFIQRMRCDDRLNPPDAVAAGGIPTRGRMVCQNCWSEASCTDIDRAIAMNEFFSTLPWRDSALLELSIVRDDQGRIDEVRLRVRWPEGGEGTVRFRDCSHVGELEPAYDDERVLGADVEDGWAQTSLQEELSRKCAGHLPLHFYRFRTSARAEAIEIYASRLEILT